MSKVTKNQLQRDINNLAIELTNLKIELSEKNVIDIETEPQLKPLDKSVFDGLDEKWRFAAIDEDGRAHKYEQRPDNSPYGEFLVNINEYSCDYELIGKGYDASNWQNSLIERDTAKELTGSDLARAMLERGDILVACKFSDYSEYKAIKQPVVTLIKEFNGTCFRNTNGSFYRYVVPINLATGEPLTQAEAGL